MSFSQFTLIGKAYYQPARHPLSWYEQYHSGQEAAWATKHAIEDLDSLIDFSDFDRWEYNGPYDHTPGQDTNLDAVFVCFRKWYICPGVLFGCSFIAQGWYPMSLPGGSVDVDNGERHIISSQSVDVTEMIQYPRLEHLIHEFGHIWGLPHNYSGGFWSLMGHRYPNVSSFMNSYERERLGWMTFTDVTVNNTNVTIADFGTAAVAYRVRIDTNNVYLLENHQCISPYDVVNKLDPDLNPDCGKGLYILRLKESSGQMFVVCADGK